MVNVYAIFFSHLLTNNQFSWLDASFNLITAGCYFAIAILLAVKLWHHRQQGIDAIVAVTIVVFFSCASSHTLHAMGMWSLGNTSLWQTVVDVIALITALVFLSFHQQHGLLVRYSQILKSHAELEQRNLALEQIIEQSSEELRWQNQRLEEAFQDLQRMHTYVIQMEKMSMLGQMVAVITHEITNPINFIHNNLHHLEDNIQDLLQIADAYKSDSNREHPSQQAVLANDELDFILEDLPRIMDSMHLGVNRILELVVNLRNFYCLDAASMKLADLHGGIESTLVILRNRWEPEKIDIIRQFGDIPQVECHINQLNQVFMNLIGNAIESLLEIEVDPNHPRTREIAITTECVGCDRVAVRITDNGPGIPVEIQQRLFEPFFTTKPIGVGTGLGLSICDRIVRINHQGRLYCCSAPDIGTTMSVELPIFQTISCAKDTELLPKHEIERGEKIPSSVLVYRG
jgi:signal transduction histidine kinase